LKIIRVFPRRTSHTPTDELAFIGYPPLPQFRPDYHDIDGVRVSCTFTWDKELSWSLCAAWGELYKDSRLGGPALNDDNSSDYYGFIPGMYVRSGVTFTTRGCNNQCPFCLVSKREGKLRQYPDFAAGNIVQDNNILQADKSHWDKVIQMLRTQKQVEFSGGLEARLLTDQHAADIRSLHLKQVFLACDNRAALKPLQVAVKRLQLPIRKARCYVLIAYNGESISEARERLEDVYRAGALPFAQLYQPPDKLIEYSKEWKGLARTFSRPAATLAEMKTRIN